MKYRERASREFRHRRLSPIRPLRPLARFDLAGFLPGHGSVRLLHVLIEDDDGLHRRIGRRRISEFIEGVTTNTRRIYPSEASVYSGPRPTKAMADQIATASKRRLLRRLGSVSESDMRAIERALWIQLGL